MHSRLAFSNCASNCYIVPSESQNLACPKTQHICCQAFPLHTMNTLEPRAIYNPITTYLPITPPYEFAEINQAMFEHPLVAKTTTSTKQQYASDKPSWMVSPDSSRFDDDSSEASSDSEKSLTHTLHIDHFDQEDIVDRLEVSVPSKMRYKHQQIVSTIMNNNSHIPLKSAVAIANGLGRYRSGRKVIPHRSPSAVSGAAAFGREDLVFQIDIIHPPSGIQHRTKVISGEPLLMALKRRVTAARQAERKPQHRSTAKRMHDTQQVSPTRIWIPKTSSPPIHKKIEQRHPQTQPHGEILHSPENEDDFSEFSSVSSGSDTKPRERQPTGQYKPHRSSPKAAKPKGPCQACQEHSEGCMRKAFGWPLLDEKVYYDKGKPFVYLCNKCGLR